MLIHIVILIYHIEEDTQEQFTVFKDLFPNILKKKSVIICDVNSNYKCVKEAIIIMTLV